MKKTLLLPLVLFATTLLSPNAVTSAQEMKPNIFAAPARDLPVIAEVDVLVVGGTTGGVAAAVEAADQGASVFLIAPYPYLGEDMTATLRLWLEPGETPHDPLAIAVYNDVHRGTTFPSVVKESHAFTYKVDGKINRSHPELQEPPGRLADKKANDSVTESLQIDGDATVVADMGRSRELGAVDLAAFYRQEDFHVAEVEYACSNDGENWRPLGSVKYRADDYAADQPISYVLKLEKPIKTRYVKAVAKRTEGTNRILLAELFLVPPQEETIGTGEPVDLHRPMFPPPRPLHVKKVLDDALLDAGVDFLYGSYVASVLKERGSERVCGVVINNRQGKQVLLAKTIIDATIEHNVAQMAATNRELSTLRNAGIKVPNITEFVVVGGEPQQFENRFGWRASHQIMGTYLGRWPNDAKTESGVHRLIRYRMTSINDEQTRDNRETKIQLATYHPDQQVYADKVWRPEIADYSLLIPKSEVNRRAVLFDDMMRPIRLIDKGREIGKRFAEAAKSQPAIDREKLVVWHSMKHDIAPTRDVDGLDRPRPTAAGSVELPIVRLPETYYRDYGANYDVIVVGGGTSGAPAAIAAARAGAKVLLVEYLHGLGGVGTEGAIANYWWGNRVGFTAEVQDGQANWVIEQKKQWWRQACFEAGVEMQFGIMGVGAVVSPTEPNRVIGVKVAHQTNEQCLLGKVIIDATGSGDIAFAAGGMPLYINAEEIAVQGAGLPPKELGGRYRNTDYTFVDENDVFDATHMFVFAKEKFPNAFDLARILDTRERRRIVGDYVMTVLDQINERTYPDTIVQSRTDFDTHGYTVEPYLEVEHPDRKRFYSYSPYRINVPRGLDGILVSGLASSCERDAVPLMRMQPDLQNQGYALGYIAATSIQDGVSLREIDIRKIQRHLVEIGNLPESVLTDTDNYEAKRAGLPEAIKKLPETETFDGAHLIFWYPEEGRRLVREAFDATTDQKAKACYAQVLAVMGDPVGVESLIAKVQGYDKWDAGWNFRGMGQFGSALSPLDRLILALGRAGDKRAVPVIVEKLNLLTHDDDFSHYRACSNALEMLGDPSAVPALVAALEKPNVTGYVHGTIELAKKWDQADPKGATAEQSRRDSLLEIGLARTLYRLGDNDAKLGRSILADYAENDLRGHFSRHARLVLEADKGAVKNKLNNFR